MIALHAKYFLRCLVSLYNKANILKTDDTLPQDSNKVSQEIALAELLAFINERRRDETLAPIFKLSDLAKPESSRMEPLGIRKDVQLHSTELKN
uniref:Uncharacterized protein n=1 Tax=Amphimedon queenslandica TaxID=400682 RepID=A0A1X7V133_AMPQE